MFKLKFTEYTCPKCGNELLKLIGTNYRAIKCKKCGILEEGTYKNN